MPRVHEAFDMPYGVGIEVRFAGFHRNVVIPDPTDAGLGPQASAGGVPQQTLGRVVYGIAPSCTEGLYARVAKISIVASKSSTPSAQSDARATSAMIAATWGQAI
jgi:hypothetical protein